MTQNNAKAKQNTLSTNNIKLSGDVTGTTGAAKVVNLDTTAVVNTTPTTNQVLAYNGSHWAPATISLNGDINGTNTSNTVVAIQNNTVKNATPSDGNYLTWITADSKWEPQTIQAPIIMSVHTQAGGIYNSTTSDEVIVNTSNTVTLVLNLPATVSSGTMFFLNGFMTITAPIGGTINASPSFNISSYGIIVAYTTTDWRGVCLT